MKKMLPLIIGLVVAAVAAYFFLKKKDGGEVSPLPEGGNQNTKFLDLHDTDSIIDSLSLSSDMKKKAKVWVREINKCVKNGTNGWSRSGLESKAKDLGVTYSQQVVISAIWQMYASSQVLTEDQWKIYVSEVEELG